MSAAIFRAFDGVEKAYRRGRVRFNLGAAIPGRLGERLTGDIHLALRDVSFDLQPGQCGKFHSPAATLNLEF